MIRLLTIIVVTYLVVSTLRRLLTSRTNQKQEDGTSDNTLVECAFCGVYTPKSDALIDNNKHFCTESHRDQFNNQAP